MLMFIKVVAVLSFIVSLLTATLLYSLLIATESKKHYYGSVWRDIKRGLKEFITGWYYSPNISKNLD